MFGPLLDVQMSFRVAGARDSAPCQKWAKREGFVPVSKALAGVGRLKRICKDEFRVAGAVQETCPSEMLGGQRADFPERGCILEHQIFRFAKMILRDRCSTCTTWPHFFVAGAALYTDGVKNRKTHWHSLCVFEGSLPALLRFWCCQLQKLRKSRRIASFFDVVKFKHWGSLGELLRFWCCQGQKLRKSRRIASLSSLQIGR